MMFTVPLACLAGLISLNTFASVCASLTSITLEIVILRKYLQAAVAGYGQCGGVVSYSFCLTYN